MNDAVNSDDDDFVRVNDGCTGDVHTDNVQTDPHIQQSQGVDDVAHAGKVSTPSSSSAPDPSTAAVEVSKRVRDSEDEARDVSAK